MRKQFLVFLIMVFVLGLVPINFSNAATLSSKLKGKILLQVESKGEAWYVEPKTGERHYMANGDEAYNIMRNLGVGITNKDLEKINASVKSKLPTSTVTSPVISSNDSSNVVEENFSDVAVILFKSQKEIVQLTIDNIEKRKDACRGVKQLWNDELTRTKIYLDAYPNDSHLTWEYNIYDLSVQYADAEIDGLEHNRQTLIGLIKVIDPAIVAFGNEKISRSQMANASKQIEYVKKYINDMVDEMTADNQKFFDFNRKTVVALDASHQVAIEKNRQLTDETNSLMAETDRLVAQSQAAILQAQNELNAARIASQPTYCSATRTGVGTVSVVCHQ